MSARSHKTSHLRAHTWKDIGRMGGLVLDGAFFGFLVIISAVMTIIGVLAVVLAYFTWPVVTLLSLFHGTHSREMDESILLADGTRGYRVAFVPERVK